MADIIKATSKPSPLAGRTIQVVNDLSLQEQLYLYERTRQLRQRHAGPSGEASSVPPLCEVKDSDIDERVALPDSTVYLLFMEGSTRTRESLRNAATYHGVKVNEFQAETSSFQKNETITDTMKMLSVYSTQRSVFVIRSPLEGVCRWLQTVLPGHAQKFGIPRPAFVNAGDGKYSRPLGEFVDTYSFLEQRNWNSSVIHVALVGDLANSRTAHSKVDGLKVFGKVYVDLVAPSLLAYPVEYRNRMRSAGFNVKEFSSVEAYLDEAGKWDAIANIWYFYYPEFKTVGEIPQNTVSAIRQQVSFEAQWRSRLPTGTCFFQTLPRNKENPIIPLSFDSTPLNGWDRVASNAYYIHVVLLAMVFGKIGNGVPAPAKIDSAEDPMEDSDREIRDSAPRFPFAESARNAPLPKFIEAVDLTGKDRTRRPERVWAGGTVPLADGLVVDHIGFGKEAGNCWKIMRMVRTILGWSKFVGREGVYETKSGQKKGIMSFPNFDFETVDVSQMKVLASIAPGCTVNAVKASKVVGKYRLRVPQRIYNLPDISCKNRLCVSNPQNKQRDVVAFFERVPYYESSVVPSCQDVEYLFVCKYCRWPHRYEDIWSEFSI
mmetsp:Transcript_137522/g.293934  ORF Transcript_137522/g.293934 Transcript_137522/m.293934 type:complete len:603 (+) Transcript_137522:90-1898(+)